MLCLFLTGPQGGGREAEHVGSHDEFGKSLRVSGLTHGGLPVSTAAERADRSISTTSGHLPAIWEDGCEYWVGRGEAY